MPFKFIIIPAILGAACWCCPVDARGQNPPPEPDAASGSPAGAEGGKSPGRTTDLESTARELKALTVAQAGAEGGGEIDRLKAQVSLQQKQIEVLLKMTQLLAEQVKKPQAAAPAVEKLEEQAASQEAKLQQGARRDRELAQAHDNLVERLDATVRDGPALPATARELFSPTRNNESPLAIYGTVAQAFVATSQQPSSFRDQTLELRPYLLLNEHFMMSANVALQTGNVQLYRAQAEWFINDHLTFVAGRFYSPIGFYSERLRLNWVIKTPDPPLLFNQVYPQLLSFDGLQLRGARYLGDSPFKLEYNGFVANGLSVPGSNLSPVIYSNLNNFTDQINDVNSAKAYGGRVGLSVPEIGFIGGLSGLANNGYDQAGHGLNLWDVDLNWHRGNWDARFELVHTNQTTPAQPIHRQGLYAQVAYRQYDSLNPFLQKLEGVFRFDHVQFNGINVAQVGVNFGGLGMPINRMPLDRNRYTIGANYWFYPSLALKLAFEVYDELGVPSLRDNTFIGQVVWGW
jgi:hypothetical protein